MQSVYDIEKTYLENAEEGPFFKGPFPKRVFPDETNWIDFLGFKLASPIGIPAGPLLNSKWIGFAANMGFDVLTYKTIRSHEHPSHPLPNVLPVQVHPQGYAEVLKTLPNDINKLGITNSFGNPSRSNDYLKKDIPLANGALKKGQLMIVSIFGSGKDLKDDFANAARFAKDCGAKVIEANFSCPNVKEAGGSLYHDPDLVAQVTQAIVKKIGNTPLILKVGTFPTNVLLEKVLIAATKAGARAIAGLNTLSMSVTPPLCPNRPTSGICGAPIRNHALEFVRACKKIIDKERLQIPIVATGGVTSAQHFTDLLDAGATIAMSATGMMWNPYLGINYQEAQWN
jgi:dihydroorotate dehydrogenase